MTESGPDGWPADEHGPDFDVVDEPDAVVLNVALEDIGDTES
jgi:hypothetical protein